MSSLNSGFALLFGTSSFLNSSAGSFGDCAGKEEEEDDNAKGANYNNNVRREREVSSVGGTPTRSALKQAKRDRRQKAKDGDAELAFAGGSDAWGSVEDEGMKEIVVVPTDDNGRHCALPSRHHQRQHSIQSDFGSKFVALMGSGSNKEEEPQPPSTYGGADDKPPPCSKYDNLRRGKRDLMSGWCQDLDIQKHEGHIMDWMTNDPNKSPALCPLAGVAKGGMAPPPPSSSPQSPSLSLSQLRSSTSMVVSSLRKLVETSRVMEEEDFVGNDDANNCAPCSRDPFSSSGTTTTPSTSPVNAVSTAATKGRPGGGDDGAADYADDEGNDNTISSSNLLLLFDDVNYQTLELQSHPHHHHGAATTAVATTNVDEEVAADGLAYNDIINGDSDDEITIRDHADVSLRLPTLATQPSLLPGREEYIHPQHHHQYDHHLVGRSMSAEPSSGYGRNNNNTILLPSSSISPHPMLPHHRDDMPTSCCNDNNQRGQLRSAASSSMLSFFSDRSNDYEVSLSSQQHQRSTTKSSYRQLLKMMNDSTTFANDNNNQSSTSPVNALLTKGVMRRDEGKDDDVVLPPSLDGGSGGVSTTSKVWWEGRRRGEPTTSIIMSLGVIHTQPILRTTTNRRCQPRPASTVTINECVYNLNNWDEEELGWFVIPTDNIDEVMLPVEVPRGGNGVNSYSDSYVSGECKAATSLSLTDIDGTLTHDEPSTTSPMIPLSTTTDWHNITVTPRSGRGGNTATNQHQFHLPQSISSLPSMLMSPSSSSPYLHPSPPQNHGNAVDVLSAFFTKNSNSNNDNTTFPSSMMSSMSASFATTSQQLGLASLSSAGIGGDRMVGRNSISSFYRRVTIAPIDNNTNNIMHTKEEKKEEDEMRSTTNATVTAILRQLPPDTTVVGGQHHHNQFKALLAQLQRPGGIRGPIRLGCCDDRHQKGLMTTTTSRDDDYAQSTTSTVVPPSAPQPLLRDDHGDAPHNHISSPTTSARFTDIINRYNVTVDTLTHGATNHTLQLAHPISGINAKAYQRREAQMMARDRQQQHDEDKEEEDVTKA